MTDVAILKHYETGEIRRVKDGGDEYLSLINAGWLIEDVIASCASFAAWADGSQITEHDVECRPKQVKVREDLATLQAACVRFGLPYREGESYGSRYLYIDVGGREIKVRIADHAKCSSLHDAPDFNIAPQRATVESVISEIEKIAG